MRLTRGGYFEKNKIEIKNFEEKFKVRILKIEKNI